MRPDRASVLLVAALATACLRATAPAAVPAPMEKANEELRAPPVEPVVEPPPAAPPPAAPPPVEAPKPSPPPAPPPRRATPAKADTLAADVLAGGGAVLKSVLASPEQYRFQVLYGEIVTKNGKPALERHAYRTDAEYFFPASSMKMPIALAAYDRLATLRASGMTALGRDATLRVSPPNGDPWVTTLARETRRALIVSDNFSANRLLAFVGHRELHETLWSAGLASSRVRTGFATGAELDPAEVSPAIDVVVDGAAALTLPARRSDLVLPATDAKDLAIGTANIADGRRVEGPLSFAEKNAMKLRELQDTLVHIMRPELAPAPSTKKTKPLTVTSEDLEFLRQTLGTLPSESGLAGYDRNVVADYQLSPFLRGIERVRPRGRFQIFSKVGQAYGFLIHNAYVVDKDTGRAFFLAAAIYANPEGVMNSDRYAYDSISFPALADVGEVFARHAFAVAQ